MTRTSLISVIVALLVLVGAVLGYFMWYGTVSDLSARAASLAADVQSKNDDVARIEKAKTALATLATEEATIHQYFVPASGVVPFLEELQSTGKSLGTKVTVASVSAETTGPAPHLVLSLKIEGPFNAVMRTIGAIEYAPRDTIVNDLTLGISGKNNWVATGQMTVGTRANDPAPASAAAATTTP